MEAEIANQSRFPLQISKPVLNVLSIIHKRVVETITLEFETINSERVVLALQDRGFGFWDEHNLGKIILQAASLTETEVAVETPPYPSHDDSLEWAYDQKVAEILDKENFEAQCGSLPKFASCSFIQTWAGSPSGILLLFCISLGFFLSIKNHVSISPFPFTSIIPL